MRRWALVTVLVVVSACSSVSEGPGEVGDPTTPQQSLLMTPPPRPTPLHVEADALDVPAFRQVIGRWELVSFPAGELAGAPYVLFSHLQRARKEGPSHYYGHGGICNGHSGTFLVDGDQIRLSPGSSTLMLCTEVMDDEARFGGFLASAERWERSGDDLTIIGTDGQTARFQRVDEATTGPAQNDAMTVVPRTHFVDETGFLIQLQEQEAADGIHTEQSVNWVAWLQGSDSNVTDGFRWESGLYRTADNWVYGIDEPAKPTPTSIVFRQYYEQPCVVGSLNSLHGTDTAVLSASRPDHQRVSLFVEEEGSSSPETGHTDELAGLVVADCGSTGLGVEFGRVPAEMEVERTDPPWRRAFLDGLRSEWQLVELDGVYQDPVIVAGPSTQHGSDRGVVEVRNVTSTSFEIRYREWDYLDGDHPTQEFVSYLVAERGVTMLPSGARIEAGTASTTSTLTEVQFGGRFDGQPVLTTTVLR